jgi:hypothetical protein
MDGFPAMPHDVSLPTVQPSPSSQVSQQPSSNFDWRGSLFGLRCATFFPLHDACFKIHHRPF